MSVTNQLGTGFGIIYVTDLNNRILLNLPNTKPSVEKILLLGVQSSPISTGVKAVATATIDASDFEGTITLSERAGGSTSPITNEITFNREPNEEIASTLAEAVNDFPSGFTATSRGDKVYVIEASEGEADILSSSKTTTGGSVTITTEDFSGGTTPNAETSRYRFHLNANYDSDGCCNKQDAEEGSLTNSQEITTHIVNRGFQSSILNTEVEADANKSATITRKSVVTYTKLSSGAESDLDFINPKGFSEGDILIISGESEGDVVTVRSGESNITLKSGNFSTGDKATYLALTYNSGSFYELFRSTQSIATVDQYRSAGFGFPKKTGFSTFNIPASGTVNFNVNDDNIIQVSTNNRTLTGNVNINLSSTGAVNGDIFRIILNGSINVGVHEIRVNDVVIPSEEAKNGGLLFDAQFLGDAWRIIKLPLFDTGFKIRNTNIQTDTIQPSRLKQSVSIEQLSFFVEGKTQLIKVPIFFKCNLAQVKSAVSTAGTNGVEISIKDDDGNATGTITHPSGDTQGTIRTLNPVGNDRFEFNEVMEIEVTDTGGGGNLKEVYLHLALVRIDDESENNFEDQS